MYRGTTPTLTFTIPFNTSEITKLNVAFSQNRKVVLEKTESNVTYEENKIIVNLTEEDTLKFVGDTSIDIQIRCYCNETKLASNIITTSINEILRDGTL